jgi:hypothetical protein
MVRALSVVAALALVASGCTGGAADPEGPQAAPRTLPAEASAPTSAGASAGPAAEPLVLETLIDGDQIELEVGPLAVHTPRSGRAEPAGRPGALRGRRRGSG